jgi:hypothetical protein
MTTPPNFVNSGAARQFCAQPYFCLPGARVNDPYDPLVRRLTCTALAAAPLALASAVPILSAFRDHTDQAV